MYKFTLLLFVIFSFPSFAGSKCPEEWNALKSIQSIQRNNSTEWAKNEERRRFKKYDDCRKGKNKKLRSTKKNVNKKQKNYTQYKAAPKHRTDHSTTHQVNINGRFKGEKQQAWLSYYHSPKGCKRPKTTSQFSTCLKHRDSEAAKFEVVWYEQNPPPSIVLDTN